MLNSKSFIGGDADELRELREAVVDKAGNYGQAIIKFKVRLDNLDHEQRKLLLAIASLLDVSYDNGSDRQFKKNIKSMAKEYAGGVFGEDEMRQISHVWLALALVDYIEELNNDKV